MTAPMFRVYMKCEGDKKYSFLAAFVWKADALTYADGKASTNCVVKVMHRNRNIKVIQCKPQNMSS